MKPIDRVCHFASLAMGALVVLHVLSALNLRPVAGLALVLVFWGVAWVFIVICAVRIRSGRSTAMSVIVVSVLFPGVVGTGLTGFFRDPTVLDTSLSVVLGLAWITAWVATVRVWVRIGAKHEEDSDWLGLARMNVGRGGYFGRMICAAGGVERHPDDARQEDARQEERP